MALQDSDLLLVQRSSASYKMAASELSTYVGGGNSSVTVSETAPGSPENGDMWWNSGDGNLYIYYTDAIVLSGYLPIQKVVGLQMQL